MYEYTVKIGSKVVNRYSGYTKTELEGFCKELSRDYHGKADLYASDGSGNSLLILSYNHGIAC